MSIEPRILAFLLVSGALVMSAGIYVGVDVTRAAQQRSAPPEVVTTSIASIEDQPHVVFRNTELGSKYGFVSLVSLAAPGGPRAFTRAICDRVHAITGGASCLRTIRGIVPRFEAQRLDVAWRAEQTWPLPGIPSRTRLSADGSMIATTTFVSGHSYMQTGFSTATEIRKAGGRSSGNLEKFALMIDGARVRASDRNIWGVTFGWDDNTFFATAATGGKNYLVRGDLKTRVLDAVRRGVECPSLSPDGTKIAYKKDVGGSTPHWNVAVLDLATNGEIVLRGETRSVDDQVEWLDDDSLLYGLARTDDAGVSDIWKLDVDPAARPVKFIAEASSPSVVRS